MFLIDIVIVYLKKWASYLVCFFLLYFTLEQNLDIEILILSHWQVATELHSRFYLLTQILKPFSLKYKFFYLIAHLWIRPELYMANSMVKSHSKLCFYCNLIPNDMCLVFLCPRYSFQKHWNGPFSESQLMNLTKFGLKKKNSVTKRTSMRLGLFDRTLLSLCTEFPFLFYLCKQFLLRVWRNQ